MIFRNWDVAYRSIPPWDVGEPQPAFVALARAGEIKPGSRVLDLGCGTGENAILLARSGCEVTGRSAPSLRTVTDAFSCSCSDSARLLTSTERKRSSCGI
jgi:SAM-dependent methyltransferase